MSENHVFVIPARGGSKRLPKKNVQNLLGKPLLLYSIEAALGVELGTRNYVCVSSDDSEILKIAGSVEGVHSVQRPAALALDNVATQPVIKHAVLHIEQKLSIVADIVWWMNVSVPQVTSADLMEGYHFLISHRLQEVTTVDSGGVAFSGVRLMRRNALFADQLSSHLGVIRRDYIDIHYQNDIDRLEQHSNVADFLVF